MPLRVRSLGSEVTVDFSDLGEVDEIRDDVQMMFVTMLDERVRPEHAALHGTIWYANDPNAPTPPLGPGCRCKLIPYAENEKAAEDTGLEIVPRETPEPGNEALEKFWQEAEQSEKSANPGAKVTPKDTFGESRGKQIEQGNIQPEDAFDKETGNVRPAADVKAIGEARTNGTTKRAVYSGLATLETFGISVSQRTLIVREAEKLLIEKPSLKDEQALFDIILKVRPGLVGSRSNEQARKNARKLAKAIRRTNGPLKR